MSFSITISAEANIDDVTCFHEFLRDYNTSKVGPSGYQTVYVLARNSEGRIIGGLSGSTFREWLYVENLVVQKEFRQQGLGSKILAAAEAEALARGCHSAYLDTYSFQALPFYEKNGYRVFGVLDDFPTGHKRYFLQKPSTPASPVSM